jgi:BA14K-like protein
MRSFKTMTSAVLIAATAVSLTAPAMAAPLMVQPYLAQSTSAPTENVQYYGPGYDGGYRRGYGGYDRGYRRGGGGEGAAIIGGLAAGAIIGGAIAASQANQAGQRNANYCAQRYRSYDPASGTYLNNDGNRYACP